MARFEINGKRGCFLSAKMVFALVVVVLLLLVGVVLIMHFVPMKNIESRCGCNMQDVVDLYCSGTFNISQTTCPVPTTTPRPITPSIIVSPPSFTQANYTLTFTLKEGMKKKMEIMTMDVRVTIEMAVNVTATGVIKLNGYIADLAPGVVVHRAHEPASNNLYKTTEPDGDNLNIILKEAIKMNEKIIVIIRYEKQLEDDSANGVYVYSDDDGNRFVAALPQPKAAGRLFPCISGSTFKAAFKLRLNYPSDYETWSNAPVDNHGNVSRDVRFKEFHFDYPTETHQVAFVTAKFDDSRTADSCLSDNTNTNKPISTCGRSQLRQESESLRRVHDHTVDQMNNFESESQSTMVKLDIIALPEFPVEAIRREGLIVIRDELILEAGNGTAAEARLQQLIVREVLYQWLGTTATSTSASTSAATDDWMSEGLTTWMSYGRRENEDDDKSFLSDHLSAALEADALPSSKTPLDASASLKQLDAIRVSKSAALFRMVSKLNKTAFDLGVKDFVKNRTDIAKLWQAIQPHFTAEHKNLADVMRGWTSQAGYPVVTVNKSNSDNATLSQRRFLLSTGNQPGDNPLWQIPLSVGTSGVQWCQNTSCNVKTGTTGWYLLSRGYLGFYRVNYDDDNWKKLIDALATDRSQIPVMSRAQLLMDSLALSRANQRPIDTFLALLRTIGTNGTLQHREDSPVVWRVAQAGLEYLMAMFRGKSTLTAIRNFIKARVNAHLEHVPHSQEVLLQVVFSLGCAIPTEQCSAKGREWINNVNDDTLIPKDEQSDVYCAAIRNLDIDGKDAWDKLLSSTSRTPATRRALTCAIEPAWIDELLQLIGKGDGSGFRPYERMELLENIFHNPSVSRGVAWEWLRDNGETVKQLYKDASATVFARLIESVTRYMNTDPDVTALEAWVQLQDDNDGILKQAVERVKVNRAWMKKNDHFVEDFFKKGEQLA